MEDRPARDDPPTPGESQEEPPSEEERADPDLSAEEGDFQDRGDVAVTIRDDLPRGERQHVDEHTATHLPTGPGRSKMENLRRARETVRVQRESVEAVDPGLQARERVEDATTPNASEEEVTEDPAEGGEEAGPPRERP